MAHVMQMDNGVPVPADREEGGDDERDRTET